MPIEVDVKVNLREHGPIIRSAVASMAKAVRARSRDNIRSTGNLRHWGATSYTTKINKISGGYEVDNFLKPRFLKVFETGASISGKPLMWLPAPGSNVRINKIDHNKLFRPKGTNVLLLKGTRTLLFIGASRVRIRKRLQLETIAYQEAVKLVLYMKQGIYDGGKSESVTL